METSGERDPARASPDAMDAIPPDGPLAGELHGEHVAPPPGTRAPPETVQRRMSDGEHQPPAGPGPVRTSVVLPDGTPSVASPDLAAQAWPGAAERLSTAVQFPTLTGDERSRETEAAFAGFGEFLEQSYRRVHSGLELTKFGDSRLYRWPGSDEQSTGALLLAHEDVVTTGNERDWTHPPFSGFDDGQFVWGRGTIDDKGRAIAILEAAEAALEAGITPRETVYFAFGHDEEWGGYDGAAQMAAELQRRGVQAGFVLDEGSVITDGVGRSLSLPIAAIALGGKGYGTFRVAAEDAGGHSSMPPLAPGAITAMAQAIVRLHENPMPMRLTPAVREMLTRLAPSLSAGERQLIARPSHRTDQVLARLLARDPVSQALVRTTITPTIAQGGTLGNVLPAAAEALFNVRVLQGDSVNGALEHCRQVLADLNVTVEAVNDAVEPSPISSPRTPGFAAIAAATRTAVPEALVTTGLVPAATDTNHYAPVAAYRYNFAPVVLTPTDLLRIHGVDERISHQNFGRTLDFYYDLFQRI